MKEVCELRINNTFIDLLPKTIIGNNIGPVTRIKIEKGTSEYQSIKDIAEKITKIWGDDLYRQRNLDNIKIQAEKLRYNNAAYKFGYVYESVLKNITN